MQHPEMTNQKWQHFPPLRILFLFILSDKRRKIARNLILMELVEPFFGALLLAALQTLMGSLGIFGQTHSKSLPLCSLDERYIFQMEFCKIWKMFKATKSRQHNTNGIATVRIQFQSKNDPAADILFDPTYVCLTQQRELGIEWNLPQQGSLGLTWLCLLALKSYPKEKNRSVVLFGE